MIRYSGSGAFLTISGVAALLCAATPIRAEQLTIDQIVQLAGAGLGDDAIIAKVKSTGQAFDLSASQMVDLKQRGVSSAVIAAMLSATTPIAAPAMSARSPDPMVPHPSGVYLLDDSQPVLSMKRIDPIMSSQAKTGGIIGYAATFGIASMSVKVALAGDTSNTLTKSQSPIFYFFFDEAGVEGGRSPFVSDSGPDVVSPREFTLARLMEKDGRREARVGSINIAGAKTGVMDQDRAVFVYDRVRPGVFKVYPQAPLEPGEYGFVMPIAGGAMGAGSSMARIFDFSVRPVAKVQPPSPVAVIAPPTAAPPKLVAEWRQASYSPGVSVAFVDATSIRRDAQTVRFSTMLYYRPDQGSDHYMALREANCADRTFRDGGRTYLLGKATVSTVGEDQKVVQAAPGTVSDEIIAAACDPRKLGKAFPDTDAAAAVFFRETGR